MTARQQRSYETIAGFTLLEALIAMALMGMILASLATVTAQWLPNWNRGLGRIQSSEHVALGLERIAADIAAAEFVPPTRAAGQPFFEGTDRSVMFVRTAFGPNSNPGLDIVRLAETNTDKGPVLIWMRTPFVPMITPDLNRNPLNFVDQVVLLRPPYRLRFSYSGPDRTWRESWQEQPLLPKAIRLSVRDGMTQQALSISTSAAVRAGLPAQCATAKSYDECLGSYQKEIEPAQAGKPRS